MFLKVEDYITSSIPNAYTYCGNLKIFNPEVLSPSHKRSRTPMHSKSKTIDLTCNISLIMLTLNVFLAGFKRQNSSQINNMMKTLAQTLNFEQEAMKSNGSISQSSNQNSPLVCTPVKGVDSPYKWKRDEGTRPPIVLSKFCNIDTPKTANTIHSPSNTTIQTSITKTNSIFDNTPKDNGDGECISDFILKISRNKPRSFA